MKEESEFGKGLVLCLVKFAEHRAKWLEQRELWKKMQKDNLGHFSESHAVEMHMSGASDHLYEIEVPKKLKRTLLGKKVKELQDLGLEMGPGFTGKTWTEEDITEVYELTQEIAMLIDKELGLKQQKGTW